MLGIAWNADLLLFTVFQPSWRALGIAWNSDFVAIYGIPALLARLGNMLEYRFCRYLREMRPLRVSPEWLSSGFLFSGQNADLVAIYGGCALSGCLQSGLAVVALKSLPMQI